MNSQIRNATVIAIATALPAASLSAQDWIRQAPYPADTSLNGTYFTSPDVGYIVGHANVLMRTLDGGETWMQTASVPRDPLFGGEPLHDIEFVDADHGWVFGNDNYRTVDGGQTWQELPALGSIYDIDFITTQVGFVMSNLGAWRTTDAGNSWTLIWDWENFNDIRDGDFFDADLGLLSSEASNVPGLFETTDGGDTWTRISNHVFQEILYVTEDIMVAASNAVFHRSTDGGATWVQVFADPSSGPQVGMREIVAIDEDSVAAIAEYGQAWISDDAGQTWTRVNEAVMYGEWDISFPTRDIGYIAGYAGIIYKSTDGGQTWQQISSGSAASLLDVVMSPDGVGVAVGGGIVRTEDFGRHWTVVRVGEVTGIYPTLLAVQRIDQDTFVACGDRGVFLRSEDAGRTWTQMGAADIHSEWHCNDISFLNQSEGWIFGGYADVSVILHTDDGGASWTERFHSSATVECEKGRVFPSRRGAALYPQSIHALTTDGFTNMIFRQLPGGDIWSEMQYATEDVGWYGGYFGGVLKTSNGGFIFQAQTLPDFLKGPLGDRVSDVRALSPDHAYIASFRRSAIERGILYKTTDGINWVQLDHIVEPTNANGGHVSAVDVLPTGEIWTVGASGFIWASDEPSQSQPAALLDFAIVFGSHVSGGLPELTASDDAHLQARSQFGFSAQEPNIIDMVTGFESPNASPNALDFSIEARLNNPGGNARVRIKNFKTRAFEQVGAFMTQQEDTMHAITNIDPAMRVRASDKRIELSTRISVIATFSAAGFDAWFDEVAVDVR